MTKEKATTFDCKIMSTEILCKNRRSDEELKLSLQLLRLVVAESMMSNYAAFKKLIQVIFYRLSLKLTAVTGWNVICSFVCQ